MIKFERYCDQYLAQGEHENASDQDKEDMRNCPLTNRACESVMATLDYFIKSKPNATPGFVESMTMLRSIDLDELASMDEEEKVKHWSIARKYASETIENNKGRLTEMIEERKGILKHKNIKKGEKKIKDVQERAKIVAEISKYGGQWQNGKHVSDELEIK